MIELKSVYYGLGATKWLYELLKEREFYQNIFHRKIPSWNEHQQFVGNQPYKAWYLVYTEHHVCGAIYLTNQNEIGVFLFKQCQGHGVGLGAVKQLIKKHPAKRFLANINPANERSIKMFEGLGFRHIQNTYELRH